MDAREYFNKIDEMLYHYFDLTLDKEIAGRSFDLYGFCRLDNERYIATRSVKIWEFIDYEHVLVRIVEDFSTDFYHQGFLEELVEELVDPHPNHHQTYITLVEIVKKELGQEDIQWIRKFKYSRTFRLGLRGWCDVRLVVADISQEQVYTNKAGQEIYESYMIH
ncbi:MAG: hypothetical protein ACOC1W_04900 [Bacillota bacterium]